MRNLKKAQKFLKDAKVSFSIHYICTDKYFPDDTEARDIYEFTLKNKHGVEYTARFGDSIRNTKRREVAKAGRWPNDIREAKSLGFTILPGDRIPSKEITAAAKAKPDEYMVLSCLTTHDPGTFHDFVSEYGYEDAKLTDYPKVMRVYDAVLNEYHGIRRVFTLTQREQLGELS